jgi:hypothetical protein
MTRICTIVNALVFVVTFLAVASFRHVIVAADDPLVSGKKLSEWITQLSDFDPQFRMQALDAIAKLDKDHAAPARDSVKQLCLDKRTTPNVRAKAAFILITRFGIEESAAVKDLFYVLCYSGTDRGWAMGALLQYKHNNEAVTDAAVEALKNPELDIRVKTPIGAILRKIGPSVLPKLMPLRNSADSATRTVVDGILTELQAKQSTAP